MNSSILDVKYHQHLIASQLNDYYSEEKEEKKNTNISKHLGDVHESAKWGNNQKQQFRLKF